VENFDGENVDELIKFVKFVNIFPRQHFAPYGISIILVVKIIGGKNIGG